MRVFAAVALSAALFAAPALADPFKNYMQIGPGDSYEKVVEIMGPPGNRQFKGDRQGLMWCKTGFAEMKFIFVGLDKGAVTKVETFSYPGERGWCKDRYPPLRFEDRADTVIEFRER